jgi:hypothetical protein
METLELSEQRQDRERNAAQLRHKFELAGRLTNVEDRIAHLRGMLETDMAALADSPRDQEVDALKREVNENLFDLEGFESALTRIEERLGQDEAEPVNLTLQQTLDVVDQLRGVSQIAPNDERIAVVATNVCEGLESFVTSVLDVGQPGDESRGTGPSPADLELALEVIETIGTCPGSDRRAINKSLRRQFVDGACNSVWMRVNRLFDMSLQRADRKQMLHEALTIWTMTPELGESAGSPRLSQLPTEILRTIERVLLQEIIGGVPVGHPEKLLDASMLAREFSDDYVTMIPAIQVAEAQSALRTRLAHTLARKLAHEISHAGSWHELEICMGVRNVVTSISDEGEEAKLSALSRRVMWTTWRLRVKDVFAFFKSAVRPAGFVVGGLAVAMGAYLGIAALVSRLYDVGVPLAP